MPGEELDNYLDLLFEGLDGYIYAPIRKKDGEWVQKFFAYPSEVQQLRNWVLACKVDSDVYISPSIFKEKSAKKESAIGSQVVWVEFDGQKDISLGDLPEPSAVIQSSIEGHFHVYWRVGLQNSKTIESINRRLTYALEADSSGWDINQVLRPPQTVNYKRNKPVITKHFNKNGPVGLTEFDGLPEPSLPVKELKIESLPRAVTVVGKYNFPKKVWELFNAPEPPKGLRSTYLMHLGFSLAEMQMSLEEIVSLLVEVDDRIGKFSGRSDRLVRLAEIATIAIGKVGGIQLTQGYSVSELLSTNIEIDFVWRNYLYVGGNLILSGPPGIGKTQFGLSAAMSLAMGKRWLEPGQLPPKKLLFLSMEMGLLSMKYVLGFKMRDFSANEKKLIDENLTIIPTGYAIDLQEIERLIKEHQPEGVIFDSLSSLASASLSDDVEALRIMAWEESIRRVYGCFTWFIHHQRKATADNKRPNKLSDLYGSNFFAAKTDTVVCLWEDSSRNLELFDLKVRLGETGTKERLIRTPNIGFKLSKEKTDDNSGSTEFNPVTGKLSIK